MKRFFLVKYNSVQIASMNLSNESFITMKFPYGRKIGEVYEVDESDVEKFLSGVRNHSQYFIHECSEVFDAQIISIQEYNNDEQTSLKDDNNVNNNN